MSDLEDNNILGVILLENEECNETKRLGAVYRQIVNDDPHNFTAWTFLLLYVVDQPDFDLPTVCEVYDDFLQRYPICCGYWRKYADYLKKCGQKTKCEEILERAVEAAPLSVDLWTYYLNYVKDVFTEDEDRIRRLFERSLNACGLDFRSNPLWEAYVEWETNAGRLVNVTNIFNRWLTVPTERCYRVMERFEHHVNGNSTFKILSAEEFLKLCTDVLREIYTGNDVQPSEENFERLKKRKERLMKIKVIACRKTIHQRSKNEMVARWKYEKLIKRTYFHVKPLDKPELEAWSNYLDFEIKHGTRERIIFLFERCLIVCALYEEFWMKYLFYLTEFLNFEEMNSKETISEEDKTKQNAFFRVQKLFNKWIPTNKREYKKLHGYDRFEVQTNETDLEKTAVYSELFVLP